MSPVAKDSDFSDLYYNCAVSTEYIQMPSFLSSIWLFFNALGSSGLKEISTSLLDLITWDGGKKKLRVYAKTAKNWKSIARKLGLEDESPGCIKNTAQRHFNDDNECVTEVFGKWLENAVGLPNADQFPKSWEGLLNLLNESELGEVAKELRTAIEAPDSSAMREE